MEESNHQRSVRSEVGEPPECFTSKLSGCLPCFINAEVDANQLTERIPQLCLRLADIEASQIRVPPELLFDTGAGPFWSIIILMLDTRAQESL